MKLHHITVTDENGNDFGAVTAIPDDRTGPDDHDVVAFAFIYGDNGFGAGNGVVPLAGLKRLDDGKYGA